MPHRRKNVPSTATVTGPPSAQRYLTISRATARPRSSASHAAWEKNQHARRNRAAIPAAAAIATTVRRLARIIPHASAMNSAWVDRRWNTGASSSSRARQVAGTASPAPGSPASPGGPTPAPAGQPSPGASSPPERDGRQHVMADWPAKEASQSQMISTVTCPMGLPCCCPGATPLAIGSRSVIAIRDKTATQSQMAHPAALRPGNFQHLVSTADAAR